jgi:YYY domain-containing protein
MAAFIAWYVIITLLGWLAFPLVYRLFPALADRGFTLARAAGLLLWAYVFWLCTTLGLSFNDLGGILFGLVPLIALSAWAVFQQRLQSESAGSNRLTEIRDWLRNNIRLVVTAESLFLGAFILLALLRAGNPTLDNAEKPMELMFINSILRSPGFPPHDGWLSGYAISYYYFGYVMTAMLAKLSGVSGSIAHNLMTALVFALGAIGSYGILFNLLVRRGLSGDATMEKPVGASLVAPLFLLVVSNMEGFLEVLHRWGVGWSGERNFWTWLDIRELNQAPAEVFSFVPDRFWWWWRASRVISDYDLKGEAREVISEFPFFSFLHADLHPHVLAIPFILLTVAAALNIFLGGWRGESGPSSLRLKIHPAGFAASALLLGGLAILNIWDIVLGVALLALAYGLMCVRIEGWSWERPLDMLGFGVTLGISAVALYLPFYFGFSSQAGGLLPNIVSPTRGAQLWVMFLPLFLPLLAWLAYHSIGQERRAHWRTGFLVTLGLVLILSIVLVAVSWIATLREPNALPILLSAQGVADLGGLARAALARRGAFLGGLLTMLAVFVPAVSLLAGLRKDAPAKESGGTAGPSNAADNFALMLIILGALLVIGPEFVYLRDQFGYRLNTIFKFYFQAWLLWSIPAALAVVILGRTLRGAPGRIFSVVLPIMLFVSLTYPVLAIANKTNNFKPHLGWTLDDFRRIERGNPDEAAAILWLKSAQDGTVAEAVGGSYTEYGRVSVYTGLPAVLGWPGHEVQWRGTADPQGSRQDDIKILYESPDWDSISVILDRYDIRYVYIGALERSTYEVDEQKLANNLSLVFQQGEVHIYEVP